VEREGRGVKERIGEFKNRTPTEQKGVTRRKKGGRAYNIYNTSLSLLQHTQKNILIHIFPPPPPPTLTPTPPIIGRGSGLPPSLEAE